MKFELSFTQTPTIIVFMCTLLLAVAFTFELEQENTSVFASLLKLVHLGAFSTWLGVQVWVTFFAGMMVVYL